MSKSDAKTKSYVCEMVENRLKEDLAKCGVEDGRIPHIVATLVDRGEYILLNANIRGEKRAFLLPHDILSSWDDDCVGMVNSIVESCIYSVPEPTCVEV